MKLFEFDKLSYKVHVSEEAFLLAPFKAIYKRDKSRTKNKAISELAYVWFFTDITSPYLSTIDLKERQEEIIRDLELPDGWKPDKVIDTAIDYYRERSRTITQHLYEAAMIAASAVNDVFARAEELIKMSKDEIAASEKVINALGKVPGIMAGLKKAEKELIKEIEDKEGKKKGSQTFNTFEDMDF